MSTSNIRIDRFRDNVLYYSITACSLTLYPTSAPLTCCGGGADHRINAVVAFIIPVCTSSGAAEGAAKRVKIRYLLTKI